MHDPLSLHQWAFCATRVLSASIPVIEQRAGALPDLSMRYTLVTRNTHEHMIPIRAGAWNTLSGEVDRFFQMSAACYTGRDEDAEFLHHSASIKVMRERIRSARLRG